MAQKSILNDDWLWLTFAWALMGVIGSTLIYLQDKNYRFSEVDFLPATGVIKSFNTFTTGGQDCDDVVNMEVDYFVNGKKYSTSRFGLGHIDRRLAQSVMDQFRSGNNETQVWYNPLHPEAAVMHYDRSSANWQFFIFLAFTTLPLLILMLLRAITNRVIS